MLHKKAIIGIAVGVIIATAIIPIGYGIVQRTTITNLQFDFDRVELTDVDVSQTKSIGSMQKFITNVENPSMDTLNRYQSIEASMASPEALALDLLANTRLVFALFIDVHNPSSIDAIIDRAQIQAAVNNHNLPTQIMLSKQQKIPAGGDATIMLEGISISGKDVASIVYNFASDDFVLTFDFAIVSYYPTLFGEMQIPANINLKMFVIPPKPTLVGFTSPNYGIEQLSLHDNVYKLSFANRNDIPISGKVQVGVLKGNVLSGIGLCDPACIAPIDNGFATFLRIQGSSIFDVQVFEYDRYITAGETYVVEVKNPKLRSNANSAFVIRWAPDYEKIPYMVNTDVMGIKQTTVNEFESSSLSTVRKVVYNIARDFGYIGSEKFVSPKLVNKVEDNSFEFLGESQYLSTSLSLSTNTYSANDGQSVKFSGRLTDKYGDGIRNALIYIKDEDALANDDIIGTVYTDSNGRYSLTWIAETIDSFDSTIEVYAVFEGDTLYETSRSTQIDVEVIEPIVMKPVLQTTYLSLQASSYSVYEGDKVNFNGGLTDVNGVGVSNKRIDIKDNDPLDEDDLLVYGYTDSNGWYSFAWTAQFVDIDNRADVFASFEGDSSYQMASSQEESIDVYQFVPPEPQPEYPLATSLSLQTFAYIVYDGDLVQFSGSLSTQDGNVVANALIYVKDEDTFAVDDIIGTVYTDSQGRYSLTWKAKPMDDFDNTIEVYAVFEGSSSYETARSIQIDIELK